MSVLVTVAGSRAAADLELDDTRPVGELAPEVAAALGESAPALLRTASGAALPAGATLAAAGVVDGHRLTLVPARPEAGDTTRDTTGDTAGDTTGDTAGDTAAGLPPVLACYLALDTSDSMAGAALEAVNAELARLWAAVRRDPRLADSCRLAVVAFDADARVAAPLAAAGDLARPPRLAATRPATDYEAAFRLLRRQVTRDLTALRAAGRRPLRPLVVLVTDGRPTRGYWPPAHAALVDPASPDSADVVAFGFGDASELAVRRVGTAGAFLPARTTAGRAQAPAGMLAAVMTCVLEALGAAVAPSPPGAPAPRVPPPAAPRGWRSLTEAGEA